MSGSGPFPTETAAHAHLAAVYHTAANTSPHMTWRNTLRQWALKHERLANPPAIATQMDMFGDLE